MADLSYELTSGSGERVLRERAIEHLHAIRDDCLARDTLLVPFRYTMPFPRRKYAIQDTMRRVIPIDHHQIALQPIPGRPRVGNISTVYVRVPTPYYLRKDEQAGVEDEYAPRETPQWNDIFLELFDEAQHPLGKYHLNMRGLHRYETVAANGQGADVVRNHSDYMATQDFFISQHEPESPELVPGFTIHSVHLILRNYTETLQTNA